MVDKIMKRNYNLANNNDTKLQKNNCLRIVKGGNLLAMGKF